MPETCICIHISDCDTFALPGGEIESEVLPLTPAAIIVNGAVMASHSHRGVQMWGEGYFKLPGWSWPEVYLLSPPFTNQCVLDYSSERSLYLYTLLMTISKNHLNIFHDQGCMFAATCMHFPFKHTIFVPWTNQICSPAELQYVQAALVGEGGWRDIRQGQQAAMSRDIRQQCQESWPLRAWYGSYMFSRPAYVTVRPKIFKEIASVQMKMHLVWIV